MEEKTESESKSNCFSCTNTPWLGFGVAIGVGIGVALDNVGLGIAIGLSIGAAMTVTGGLKKKPKSDQLAD